MRHPCKNLQSFMGPLIRFNSCVRKEQDEESKRIAEEKGRIKPLKTARKGKNIQIHDCERCQDLASGTKIPKFRQITYQ